MSPYPDLDKAEVYDKLSPGYRMPAPEGCPDEVYELMKKCKSNYPTIMPFIIHHSSRSSIVLV
jgi:hypothetical protein